jgi:hypothetical protein
MFKTVTLLESMCMERLVRDKCTNLFGLVVSDEKKFYNIDTRWKCYKTFFLYSMMLKTVTLLESMCMERLVRDKCNNLFGLVISDKEKKFYDIDTRWKCYKTFFLFR